MKDWLTASEIAKLRLPGLPSTKVGIAARAEREKWQSKVTTGLGGRRNVYLVPDRYTRPDEVAKETSGSDKPPLYDPTVGTGGLLLAAEELISGARLSDAELIEAVVLGVERWIEKNDLHPEMEKKAALISLLFRYFQTEGTLDEEKMDKLLSAVA